WVDIGPVYFCGPSILLFTGMAGTCVLVAGRCRPATQRLVVDVWRAPWRGALLGAIALALGAIWLGVPWGITWYQFVPTPMRFLLAIALFVALLPASLALAEGLQRLVGNGRPIVSALVWFAVALVLLLTNHFILEPCYPMFTVP